MQINRVLQRHKETTLRLIKNMETLRIKRLTLEATLPTRASPGSVGYDLYSMENMTINACERGIVSTGICATIPQGVYGRIAPRSGLSVKHGIQTGAGVIDPDYTGELKVILFNHGSELSLLNKAIESRN